MPNNNIYYVGDNIKIEVLDEQPAPITGFNDTDNQVKNTIEKFMTEEETNKLPKHKSEHHVGDFYNGMFDADTDKEFKEDMDFQVYIIWLGSYVLKSNYFEKIICPVCGKQELIPYVMGASILSGSNIFRGYCFNCHNKIAFWNHDYYLKVRQYIFDHKKGLKDTDKIQYKEC